MEEKLPNRRKGTRTVRLYLVNPRNPLVSLTRKSRWSKYRVWKPLGLLVVAGLTPPEWEITIIDENLNTPDYEALPRPDLVGITAFTSQVNRAYELAGEFRKRGVPVVMGGIHASMCLEEALGHADSVVTGEAESVWAQVLEDVRQQDLQPVYVGDHVSMKDVPPARNDLLASGYALGSIQTTRGCPLDCNFCSVSAFNGRRYRQRPIAKVVEEFRTIREKLVLIVDDNLIGTSARHAARAKDLFRAMIRAKLGKKWICQATVNMADDEELLALAAKAGCKGVFVGFESPTAEGLAEPLPGTRLWDKMKAQGRIAVHSFPEDWKYFTLSFPVGRYKHLSWTGILQEMDVCDHGFYSLWHVGQRLWNSIWQRRSPLLLLVCNLSLRSNIRKNRDLYKKLDVLRGPAMNE
jgi:radical SAM superfamily enzyme YgiQ (UPF0313 family)